MYSLELQGMISEIKRILTEYENKKLRMEQKSRELASMRRVAGKERKAELEKIERTLNAACHIAMDSLNATNVSISEDVAPIPFDQMTLSRHIFACNNQKYADSNAVKEILLLISANRRWLENEKKLLLSSYEQDEPFQTKAELLKEVCDKLESMESSSMTNVIADWMEQNRHEYSFASNSVTVTEKLMIGFQNEIMIPLELQETLREGFKNFIQNQYLVKPVFLDMRSAVNICINAKQEREQDAKDIITQFLYNMLRHYSAHSFQISVIDPLKFSEYTMGVLQPMIRKDGYILPVPRNHDEIFTRLHDLLERGETQSRGHQVVVLEHFPEKYENREIQLIQQLEANQEEYGISFIIMHETEDASEYPGNEKGIDSYIRKLDYSIFLEDVEDYLEVKGSRTKASFEKMSNDNLSIVQKNIEACQERYAEIAVTNEYQLLFDLNELPLSKNREITRIPFGLDEAGEIAYCSFENENFAAYISGAARSGKSTCLHALISGIVRNYHPDVAEMWLLDFKMLEFRDYASCNIPHVKYLLLEKSEELIADILVKATEELNRRQNIFNRYGFKRLSDLPMDMYMPSIFLIIDEFAQVSQIIKKLTMEGKVDYTIMLENLLAKGAALGFKFIFADQGFVDGVSGLTEKARHQMQMRFAFKNTDMEIKATLEASSELLNDKVVHAMHNLQPHYVLYKSRDEHGYFHINQYLGLYLSQEERLAMLKRIRDAITDAREKNPVIVTGGEPKVFARQKEEFEKGRVQYEIDEGEEGVLIFAGSPLNMEKTAAFPIWDEMGENILLVNGDSDSRISVISSIAESVRESGFEVEIHSYKRDRTYRTKQSYLRNYSCNTDVESFCYRINNLVDGQEKNRLVILMGLESLLEDAEIFAQMPVVEEKKEPAKKVDLFAQMQLVKNGERTFADMERMNRELEENEQQKKKSTSHQPANIREDIKQLLIRGPKSRLHFLVVAEDADAFERCSLEGNLFKHKLVFQTDQNSSYRLIGTRKASELENGNLLYVKAQNTRLLRPYLHPQLTIDGWRLMEDGSIEMV